MQKKLNRILFVLILMIVSSSDSDRLFAQFGSLASSGAPISLGIQYDYYDPAILHQITARFGMTRYSDFVPEGSPFAQSTSLGLAGGIRFGPGNETDFRWRISLLNGNVPYKKLFIFGISLLDINKTGLLEEDYLLAEGRAGFAPVLGGKTLSFCPRLAGTIGGGSLILGEDNYADIAIADTLNTLVRLSGLQLGFKAGFAVRIKQNFLLMADYSDRTLFDGTEPRFRSLSGELRWLAGNRRKAFRFFVRYQHENASLNKLPLEHDNNSITGGVTYSFQPQSKRKWF
jgi:hypothetical protein